MSNDGSLIENMDLSPIHLAVTCKSVPDIGRFHIFEIELTPFPG